MEQGSLFEAASLPPSRWPEGLVVEPEWLDRDDEQALIELVRALPLVHAKYKRYTARRRVVSYGGSFDYDSNRLLPTAPLIDGLHGLRERVAGWLGVTPDALVHALVAEYAPGTPLGWHRDVPDFEDVVGVSLGAPATLRFRPWPAAAAKRDDTIRLSIEPRSIYRMQGPSRWQWQHSVAPVDALRWSITFRTRAAKRASTHRR